MGTDVDSELQRLRADNHALAEELQQCQADKDFVWSLWRKLQVANPDITQAVSMVVQREKEKSELKDLKVLGILQLKDDKIEELHSVVSSQARELQDLKSKKTQQHDDVVFVKSENLSLQEKLSTMEEQLRSIKTREENMDQYHRQVINDMQSEKEVLAEQLSENERKLKKFESHCEELRSELKNMVTQKGSLERQVKKLQSDSADKVAKFEELLKDLDCARRLVQKQETQTRQNQLEIESKNTELETVRRELSDLWSSHHQLNEHATQQAELIRQLQSLQQDTQKMLKNQEDAYSIESTSLQQMYAELTTQYEVSKKAEADLRREMLTLKKQIFERDETIVQLQHKLDLAHIDGKMQRDQQESFIHPDQDNIESVKLKMESLITENHALKDKLEDKNRIIDDLEKKLDEMFKFDVDNPSDRSHSTPIRKEYRSVAVSPFRSRSRSPSPMTLGSLRSPERNSPSPSGRSSDSQELKKMLNIAEDRVTELKTLLKLKSAELKELRIAHDKRLERLKSLQTSYKMAKEQLKTFEEDQGLKKKKNLKKAHPRQLQKEDSDAVWNELAYYRNEAKTLHSQNMNLQEDNDILRVQSSQDAATLHELRMALEQEKEELEYQLHQRDIERSEQYTSDVGILQKQVEDKSIKLEHCERDLKKTLDLQEKLLEERRVLRGELMNLKQAASSYRIQIASLKRDVNRLEKALERGKLVLRREGTFVRPMASRISRTTKRFRRPFSARQNSRNVSSSTDKSSSLFEEPDENDWEEVDSETEETLTESDSLGRAIVTTAQSAVSTSDLTSRESLSRQPKPKSKLKRNPRRSVFSSSVAKPVTRQVQPSTKTYRDASTSPVSVLSASPLKYSPARRSLPNRGKPLQQRVDSLQQQLGALRDSRAYALKSVSDLKETNEQLQTDLNHANQRLKMARQNIQKLSGDLERAQRERDEMESRLDSSLSSGRHADHDWKTMENRLKSSTFEVTRQSGLIRTLKTENETLTDQAKSLQDRVNRLERDNSQKRTLLEDQKSRLKQAKESVHNESSLISDLEARIQQQSEANEKVKIQLDSSKKRLTVISKEKKEYEDRYFKISSELEKKTRQLAECQAKKVDLESAMSDLESTAQHQLHGLATHSEAAIEAVQSQLKSTHTKLQLFQKFVRSLVHEVCVRCQQARSLTKQFDQQMSRFQQPPDRSLMRAQTLARDILNISQSDIEDLMSVDLEKEHLDAEIEEEKRRDKKWSKKCEKLMSSQDDFVLPLVELIMEKIDERQELITRINAP